MKKIFCLLICFMAISFVAKGQVSNVVIKKHLEISNKKLFLNKLIIVFSEYDVQSYNEDEEFLYTTTLDDYIDINDSNEVVNRYIYVFNDSLFLWLFRPIMRGYFTLVPKTGRIWINNISSNIEFPSRAVSCLLQGRYYDSSVVLWRFLINTVLGGLGAYDIAEEKWQIRKRDEDIGQALASWGYGYGCYLYLPIVGPSSVRDGIGLIFDYALDPKTYLPIPGVQAFTAFNKAGLKLDDYLKLINSFEDPYMMLKTLWNIQRSVKVNIDK